jgi:AbrB family looped-hinge helix DNA binding protein
MSSAKVTSKGQVTIPVSIRKHLKLKPGDRVDFQIEGNGTARIFPLSRSVSEVYGMLSGKNGPAISTEEMDERLREKFREGQI